MQCALLELDQVAIAAEPRRGNILEALIKVDRAQHLPHI